MRGRAGSPRGQRHADFLIPNVDGDLTQTNKRLGQLALLRDALARVLPVELDYTSSASQGNLIDSVTVHLRPSIDGCAGTLVYDGVVIGLSITELGPQSGGSPYLDAADIANVVLLTDVGVVAGLLLDLQRPDPLTAQGELGSCGWRTGPGGPWRYWWPPVSSRPRGLSTRRRWPLPPPAAPKLRPLVSTCFLPLAVAELDYLCAFIERLGQRYESYVPGAAPAISHVKVVYTTAPGQTRGRRFRQRHIYAAAAHGLGP